MKTLNTKSKLVAVLTALVMLASTSVLFARGVTPAVAVDHHSCEPLQLRQLEASSNGVNDDVGDVAVIADNGLIITERNSFDLPSTTLRFEPAGGHSYTVSRSQAGLDPDFGPALTFGFPDAPYTLDDDTEEVLFPAGFHFFGTTYASVFVNTNGDITPSEPDFASVLHDKAHLAFGPPRISGFGHDLDLNSGGSIHASLRSSPDRLVVTWNGVSEFGTTNSNTFQITLFSSGAVTILLAHLDITNGVVGIAEGGGKGPFHNVDFSAAPPTPLAAGAIFEAFSQFTQVSKQGVAQEFYKTHGDKYDFLVMLPDFPTDGLHHSWGVSNQTHGIGAPLGPTTYDFSSSFGSAGELEQIVYINDIHLFFPNSASLVDPPIEPYRSSFNILTLADFGQPVTFDGQAMSQIRIIGTLQNDDGEFSRFFSRRGSYGIRLQSAASIVSHEIEHRWAVSVGFVHPTKGIGFDSFDLIGRQFRHWSYFVNTGVARDQFGDVPRASTIEGNVILDRGPLTQFRGMPVSLDPGERVFITPENQLIDGYSQLDQYLMGLRRANEVGRFFYVDEPKSIFTGQTLDQFDPNDPLNPQVTMRGWNAMGGIAFKGKRVDLTVRNIEDFEANREGGDNPRGKRFWGPKGNLTLRYSSHTRRVDPNGDATITLTQEDRALGDEADLIDQNGKPVDVKTAAFILVVRDHPPSAHDNAIRLVDNLRQVWEAYANGPASGGRGRFDTRLDPPVH